MEVEESNPWLAETLRARVRRESVDSSQVAVVLVGILTEVQAAVTPIMGSRGFALLYRRSLYLTPSLQPPLASTPVEARMDAHANFDALRLMLPQQTSADAMNSGAALLQTFYDLLVNLVGLTLTERLLRSVWANHSSDSPVADSPT